MENNVDLISYLPQFLTEYEEIKAILKTEEPEIKLLWDCADKAIYNQFITTADKDGIAAFERILSLLPENSDSLEQRRARVMSKWPAKLPYTFKALIERLTALCGDDFTIKCNFEKYALNIAVHFRKYSDFLEVKKLFNEMLPANIYLTAINSISIEMDGNASAYSALSLYGKHKRISVNVKR